jgi:hypothetical protein
MVPQTWSFVNQLLSPYLPPQISRVREKQAKQIHAQTSPVVEKKVICVRKFRCAQISPVRGKNVKYVRKFRQLDRKRRNVCAIACWREKGGISA